MSVKILEADFVPDISFRVSEFKWIRMSGIRVTGEDR
jgi:hypothetical protein